MADGNPTHAVHRAREVNEDVIYYHAQFEIAAGPTVVQTRGAHITIARTGVGVYTATLGVPSGLGAAKRILCVHLTPFHAVIADAIKQWEVIGKPNEATGVITLNYTAAEAAGPAVVADPDVGDGAWITVATERSVERS